MTEPSSKASKPAAPVEDVVFVQGQTDDGEGYRVLRKRGDVVEAGLVRPIEEGRPLRGDVVRLTPREEHPLLCDVEVLHAAPRASDVARSGPAQVASSTYRRGWEAIWGERGAPNALSN